MRERRATARAHGNRCRDGDNSAQPDRYANVYRCRDRDVHSGAHHYPDDACAPNHSAYQHAPPHPYTYAFSSGTYRDPGTVPPDRDAYRPADYRSMPRAGDKRRL